MIFIQKFYLLLRLLELPVHIIKLDLAELHMLAVSFQETLHDIIIPMSGESQMPDPSVLLLLHQILEDTVLLIQIFVYIHLTDIVEQVEIKIRNLTLLKLFLKDFLHLRHVGKIISRELRREIELFTRICTQYLSHDKLRIPAMISPRRIIIVDPVIHGILHHSGRRRFINVLVLPVGER